MKTFFYRLLFLLTVCAAITACSRPEHSPGTFFTIDDASWEYGDTLVYNAERDTILGTTDALMIAVRHTNEYPYANLWLEVSYTAAADTVVADTFNITLADDYGKWYGSGTGPVIMSVDTLRLRHTPAVDARYGVRHIMRVDRLGDIEQIGLEPITLSDSQ